MITQRKLFGDFLVTKGLISEEILLEVLIDQVQGLPSIPEVVYRERLLLPKQQLEILRTQTVNKCSYRQACEQLGYWNKNFADKIVNYLDALRKPLGQLVLARTNVKISDLTKALDEYLSLAETNMSIEIEPAAVPNLAWQGATAPMADALLREFLTVMSDDKMTLLQSHLDVWAGYHPKLGEPFDPAIRDHVSAIMFEIQIIRAAAKFVRAEFMEKLAHVMGSALETFLELDSEKQSVYAGIFLDPCDLAFKCLVRQRSYLTADRSEQSFFADLNNRESYQKIIEMIHKAQDQSKGKKDEQVEGEI